MQIIRTTLLKNVNLQLIISKKYQDQGLKTLKGWI